MIMLLKNQVFLKLQLAFFICLNIEDWKEICFQKCKYILNRDEFIKKFRIKYLQLSDEEIFGFIRIYLLSKPAENNYEKTDFLFDGRLPINRICWMDPYLQEEGDYTFENTGEGIHHPFFFFCLKGIIY